MMIDKVSPKLLFSIVFGLILFSATSCLATQLILPENGEEDVEINCYFEWSVSTNPSVVEYGINLHEPHSSWVEEKLKENEYCQDGRCVISALDLLVMHLTYSAEYTWKVIAYDEGGNAIDSSLSWSFTTVEPEEDPPPPPPPTNGNGGPIDPGNPLKHGTLWGAIDALINFLFVLAFAIAPILLIYAGFLLLFRGDSAESRNKAKEIIFWTLIASSVILFAKGAPSIIKGALGQ